MKRRYIYTNKRHLKRSVMSAFFGVLCVISMIAVIALTVQNGGTGKPGYGFTGLLSALFSLIGLGLGISGILQRDCFKLFSVLGILLNFFVLAGLAGMVIWGM